eukprot:TRINITY_DN255_c0_g1_i4.p1 TRINITY_DN255_c0_g1~~TRINITY_DN255_c0_g1_i4.p1  ORF type:complete len:847 (+),score=155.94 TRINITY_DN255_c0_g1_i4:1236-3776(+)
MKQQQQQQQQQQAPPPAVSSSSSSRVSSSSSWGSLANRLGLRGFSSRSEKSKRNAAPPPPPAEPEIEIIAEDATEINELIDFFAKKESETVSAEPKSQFTIALEFPMTLRCMERLLELSKKETNKKVLGRSLEVFIPLLKDENRGLHSSALQFIRNLVTVDRTKNLFRTLNGFPYLINILRTGDDNNQKLAIACAGFLLTNNSYNADAFVDNNGVPPLIDLLKSSVEIVQLLAAGVTWVLASHEVKHQEAVFNCGGHMLLLDLLDKTTNIDIMWQSAGAIRNLVLKNEKIQAVMYKVGAVQVLLKRLDTMTNEKVIGHLAAALLALSEYHEVSKLIRDVNGFPVVFSIIESTSYSASIRDIGLGILKNLLQSEENRAFVLSNTKVLDIVLRLMADLAGNENVRASSCSILECLVNNSIEAGKIATKQGALKALINMLSSESTKLLIAAVLCLSALCTQDFSENREIAIGHIETVVRLLSNTLFPELQEAAATFLGHVASIDDQFLKALTSGEGVPLLLNCLLEEDFGVVDSTVKTLCTLFQSKDVVKKFSGTICQTKGSIVNRLLSFVLYEKEPTLQINSLKCLQLLLVDENLKVNIASPSGILVFIQCLSSRSPGIVIESLKSSEAIVNKSVKYQTLWREQGVFAKLLPLFSSDDEEILLNMMHFTRALVVDNVKSQDELRNVGILPRIVSLLSSNKPSIQIPALLLLCDTSLRHTKIPNTILKSNGIDVLVTCLTSPNEDVKRYTAMALEMLATKNVKVQNRVQDLRGFSLLVPLVLNDNAELAYHALGAILSLCYRNNSNKDECKKYGIVEAVRTARANVASNKGNTVNSSLSSRLDEAFKLF